MHADCMNFLCLINYLPVHIKQKFDSISTRVTESYRDLVMVYKFSWKQNAVWLIQNVFPTDVICWRFDVRMVSEEFQEGETSHKKWKGSIGTNKC